MATRAITTNQPEVSCDVCGRRLLRGERPDIFLAAGSRRTVCELCTARATEEGWLRESEALMVAGARGARNRRGRSLLERLRQRRDSARELPRSGDWEPERAAGAWRGSPTTWDRESDEGGDELEFAYAGAPLPAEDASGPAPHELASHEPAPHELASHELASHERMFDVVRDVAPAAAFQPSADLAADQAVEVFNASESAPRVAGIARALGEPSVTVGAAAEDGDRVRIVVAWELCWYRYEVDLTQTPARIALVGEGTELEELPPEDRLVNAAADERGELSLL